ncbi:MAG: hypothetical protein MST05_00550 [Treponema sp.]|nr:hypothetical protein [Treponema sp.]
MKKIILAVASVLALGLVVGCKQQIEGSLTVTSLNKSLDQSTVKTYVYSVSGTATQTIKQVTYEKADKYNSNETTITTVWTPTKDVSVTETTDLNNNSITYTINAYGDATMTTETIYKSSKDADPVKSKSVTDKVQNSNLGNFLKTITITKIDNKFYIENADGTKKVVEGVDFSAAEIDLSKFSDETSTESVSYAGAVYDNSWDKASATPTDYITKTTTTTSGYTYDLKLTRK